MSFGNSNPSEYIINQPNTGPTHKIFVPEASACNQGLDGPTHPGSLTRTFAAGILHAWK